MRPYDCAMNHLIVFVAKYFLFISVLAVAIYWLKLQQHKKLVLAVQLVVGGVIALLLAKIGAHFYYDTRPFVSHHIKPLFAHGADNGFPSDHALLTSFLGFTMLFYSRRLGIFLLAVAVAVGAARVAAHIHSPIDIVGSFVFAAIGVGAARFVVDEFTKRNGRRRNATGSRTG